MALQLEPTADYGRDVSAAEEPFVELVEGIVDRLRDGQAVIVEALVEAHPQYADQLRRLLPTLEAMADLSRSGSRPPSDPTTENVFDSPGRRQLGDFCIVREIGRGGMGVVYEAEQLSLRRKVALKVLPFAAVIDASQLQRFRNEAHAAAQLHHQNIVPVYSVGCERGVHYYAMQYIEGQNLAELIAQLKRTSREERAPESAANGTRAATSAADESVSLSLPSGEHGDAPAAPRTTADSSDSVGAQAAVDTAPVALLSTERRRAKLAYFRTAAQIAIQAAEALDHAHQLGVIHRDIKPANLMLDVRGNLWITDFGLAQVQTECSITMTGDVLGTIRYMSPEQALAKRVPVDHRTDIYSLGVTLYELLTLEPAIRGRDRRELLSQIAFEEPRAPRRLEPEIPSDFETIILKCIAKNPSERYARAQELADDLRRFLEDRPIQARRPTVAQRMRKWARRHRAVVSTAAACLLLTLTLLGGTIGWGAYKERVRLERAKGEVRALLSGAQRLVETSQLQEARVAARQAEAFFHGGLDDAQLEDEVRQLVVALEAYRRLEETRTAARDKDFGYALVDQRYTEVFRDCGIDVQASDPDESARRVRESVIRDALVAGLEDWAYAQRAIRAPGDQSWRRLLDIAQRADPNPERNRVRDVIERTGLAGSSLLESERDRLREQRQKDDLAELRILAERLSAPEEIAKLPAATLVLLGKALRQNDAPEEAATILRRAQRKFPHDFWVNFELACALELTPHIDDTIRYHSVALALSPESAAVRVALAKAVRKKGAIEDATALCHEAVQINPDYAPAYCELGCIYHEQGRLDECVAAMRDVDRVDPNHAHANVTTGLHLLASGAADKATVQFEEGVRACRKMISQYPHDPYPRVWLANAFKASGRLDEAVQEYRSVIDSRPDAVRAHLNLGTALLDQGKEEEAIATLGESVWLRPHDCDLALAYATLLLRGGDTDEYDRICRSQMRQLEEKSSPGTRDAYLVARIHTLAPYNQFDPNAIIELARRAVNADPRCTWYLHTAGMAHYRAGQFERAVEYFTRSMDLDPFGTRWLGQVGNWLGLALAHQRLGDEGRAKEWLDKATGWLERVAPRAAHCPLSCEAHGAFRPHDRLVCLLLRREAESLIGGAQQGSAK